MLDEDSIIKPTRKKKVPIRIESDESESEVSSVNIEVSESTDDDDSDKPQIENEDSEDEKQETPNNSGKKTSGVAIQKTPNDNKSPIEIKKVEGRPSLWEENDILSSTRIYSNNITM